MRILDIVEDFEIKEARRNNFGREVSTAQGQALAGQLASGDPNAQQKLAQAKSAQATNSTDATGDTLGQTTPQQRLATKRATAPVQQPPRPADVSNPEYQAPGTDLAQADNIGSVVPGQDQGSNTVQTTAPKQSIMQRAGNALQGVSNVVQRGAANAKDNIPAIANYAGDLAQNTAPGVGNLAKGVGNAVKGIGSGIGKGLQGVGSVVKGVGDVASQAAGGITQTIGAAAGGLKHGYQQAGGGQKFGSAMRDVAGIPAAGGGSGGGGTGGAGSGAGNYDDEISNLKNTIQQMDQRLRRVGAE